MGHFFPIDGFDVVFRVELGQQDVSSAYKNSGHQVHKGAVEDDGTGMHGDGLRGHAVGGRK